MTPARLFFTGLFNSAPPDAWLVLSTAPGWRSRFYHVVEIDRAADEATRLGDTSDVYFGCGLRDRDHGEGERGGNADVIGMAGVHLDADVAKLGAKKLYFATRAALLAWLRALPIPPTIIVWTGGGAHVYWLFKEFWMFRDDGERQQAAALLERWQAFLRERAKAQGVAIDATHDLARVLRVPGTINHKWRTPVVLEPHRGPRINPGDLEALAGHLPLSTTVTFDLTNLPAGTADAEPPARLFAGLCESHPKFAATWRRERTDLRDLSPSAYDLALASIVARAGWSDAEIVALLIAHRRHHADPPKLRVDYFARTIARARASHPEAGRNVATDGQRATA